MNSSLYEYSNCASYVYHHFGLIDQDIYTSGIGIARTWGELLTHFAEVPGVMNAHILAIVFVGADVVKEESELLHLAVINRDKKLVSHRPGDMADVELGVPIETVLRQYLVDSRRMKKFLEFQK